MGDNNNKCFQCSIIIALHHQEFKSHPERISSMHEFFSHKYYWEGIEFPAGIKDWKIFEKNNETIALNIVQVPHDEIKITHAYSQNIIVNVKIK